MRFAGTSCQNPITNAPDFPRRIRAGEVAVIDYFSSVPRPRT